MSFDAGQFFNNLFNRIGNISGSNISRENKTDGYNFHEEAKMLPDETPDEKVAINRNIAMYAVPSEIDEKRRGTTVQKYAIYNPTEEAPAPSVKPDIPQNVKYGIPSPEPSTTPTENIAMYAVPNPPEPSPAPTENIAMYAVPNPPEPSPAPTENIAMYAVPNPTYEPPAPTATAVAPMYAVPNPTPDPTPTPQPINPQKPSNPWNFNFQNIFTNIFGNWGSSFGQRLNNILSNMFSRWR